MKIDRLPCRACGQPTPQTRLSGAQVQQLLDAGVEIPTHPLDGMGALWVCLTCRSCWVYFAADVEAPPAVIDLLIPPPKERR